MHTIKPIFHCNAKLLALGLCIGSMQAIQLATPTCWYLKRLPDPMRRPPNPLQDPTDPMRLPGEPMEYSSGWVGKDWIHVGHLHFMLFVSISFKLGSQRKPNFQWNMGFSHIDSR